MEPLIIRKEILVPASREALWHAWTTSEGVESFFAPEARIELAVGGTYECYFLLENPAGLRGSEGCRVISYHPMDYLSFSWNAPPEFPNERAEQTTVVVEIDRASESEYRVRLTHFGFGDTPPWREVYEYFNEAWTGVLVSLRELFVNRGVQNEKAEEAA